MYISSRCLDAVVEVSRLLLYSTNFSIILYLEGQWLNSGYAPPHFHLSPTSIVSLPTLALNQGCRFSQLLRLDAYVILTSFSSASFISHIYVEQSLQDVVGRYDAPEIQGGIYADVSAGFKKNVNRATTQVMMKTGLLAITLPRLLTDTEPCRSCREDK